jgi:uncharacterized damage-inducible protein DinB
VKPSQMFSHWEQVRYDLLATIDQFSQAELIYAPFQGSWPVGQIMLHIAECEDFWLHSLVTSQFKPPVDYKFENYPTMEAISEVLRATHQRTLDFLDSLIEADLSRTYRSSRGETFTLSWIIWHVLEHEIHHRGELSLALGLLGRSGLDV